MKQRYSTEQIIEIIREVDAGVKPGEVCRKYGISKATLYNWRVKYGGMNVNDAKRLKALEEENRQLKQIVAEQTLDNRVLKELLSKKF